MIVLLRYTNALAVPVELRSNMGAGQPVLPQQALEMTFELTDDGSGAAELVLICEPGEARR